MSLYLSIPVLASPIFRQKPFSLNERSHLLTHEVMGLSQVRAHN